MEEEEVCILCDKVIQPQNKTCIKKHAIAFLIKASKRRNDKKYFRLQKFEELNIHKACHLMYLRESSIKATTSGEERRQSFSESRTFDFDSLCIFCGDDASDNYIQLQQKCKDSYSKVTWVTSQDTRGNILKKLEERSVRDTYNKAIYDRISCADDLVKLNARYHVKCFVSFYNFRENKSCERPISDAISPALQFVINYLIENSEECQFSLRYILEQYSATEKPQVQYIKQKLLECLGTEIVIYSVKSDYIICFLDSKEKVLTDSWYNNRCLKNEEEEKRRIVKAAANIILQEIRGYHYDIDNYPSPNYFLDTVDADIPPNLKFFLDILIKSHKKQTPNFNKWDNRIATYAHCIISSIRPRSFLSPILLGLSSMMHKKHASKNLIDSLNYIGLCASYNETVLFESSIVHDPKQYNLKESYLQFIFDNADHNTDTIDGRNTFHSMGGIMCVTPATSVKSHKKISRLKNIPSSDSLGKFGFLPLKPFQRGNSLGLKNAVIKNLDIENPIKLDFDITCKDFVWFYSKSVNPDVTVGWNEFMEVISKSQEDNYDLSKIIPLPFVNAPPSQYDTIFTVLLEADARCKTNGQKHTFVTFDQPLYLKAQEIMYSCKGTQNKEMLSSVIVRLGGFHCLMSFLGSIGYIMDGSGLKDAFCKIYAEVSAGKALTGHAFSKSVRGHLLVQETLADIILNSIQFNESEKETLNEILNKIETDNFQAAIQSNICGRIKNKFIAELNNLKRNGPTAELWVQYFTMVEIAKQFIEAERTGDWILHLKSMKQMLPYFHASGHLSYAKSAHLYLQEMFELENRMDMFEFQKFAKEGYFTIRRTDKYRSGIWSDMTIEQMFRRPMKTNGGLTHGPSMSDSVLYKWILSMIVLIEVSDTMERFCNESYVTSEQRVDTQKSRIKRDTVDLRKLREFFDNHDPFPVTNNIVSISSGLIGDDKINCYKAHSVGLSLMNKMIGDNFSIVKLHRKNKILPIKAASCSIKINNEVEVIDASLIFQRLSLNIESRSDMKKFLAFELAPYPLSLFDEGGMRKTRKSVFYENFESVPEAPSENVLYVVDGGFLIHRVVWHINQTIGEILQQYVDYVLKYYTKNSCIVFDGYSESGTKSVERLRHQSKNSGRDIKFDINTKITLTQEKVLASENNKKNLINLLCKELNKVGCLTKIADEDADSLIVNSAITLKNDNNNVVIVGEDVDLLILLTQLTPSNCTIYFLKPNRGKVPQQLYSNNCFKYPQLKQFILFLHAFSGCDTTSCFYKQGKNKLIKTLLNNDALQTHVKNYYEKNATVHDIEHSGYEIIARMYSTKMDKENLVNLRYAYFQKSTIKNICKLESLPPTEGAAKQHCLRTFYQIQVWLGNQLNAEHWGWKITRNGLQPNQTEDQLIPDELLKMITCRCESRCKEKNCGCRKHGLKCTRLCTSCQGECSNADKEIVELPEDADLQLDDQECVEEVLIDFVCNSEELHKENEYDNCEDDDSDVESEKESCTDETHVITKKPRLI